MFIYYNANPKKEIVGDCVIRAISVALNINYYDVIDILSKESNYFNCDMLVCECYNNTLTKRFGLKQRNGKNRTVEELANIYNNKILIIRIDQHLTCSKFGTIFDIWDTSNEIVDKFWIVE